MLSHVCWLCVFVVSMYVRVGWAVQVTVDPPSFTAFQGETVTFNCTYSSNISMVVYFEIDGQVLNESYVDNLMMDDIIKDDVIVGRSISFLANADVNCSNFTCIVSDSNGSTKSSSEPAVLKVQGLLPAPGNVNVDGINATAIEIAWTPPSTLDITNVDPDISSYTVYITNTNTDNTGTVSVTDLDGNGVVETEYIFTGLPGEDPNPCHVYQFSVSAWNVVGEGERSDPMDGSFSNSSGGLSGFTLTLTATLIIGVVCTCYGLW